MRLDDTDGSACALLGRFERLATLHGWTEDEIDAVTEKALAGGPGQLLRTLREHIVEPTGVKAGEKLRRLVQRDEPTRRLLKSRSQTTGKNGTEGWRGRHDDATSKDEP